MALAAELGGHGHAHGGAEPLTQGTGGHIHPGHILHIRMPGEMGLDGAEELQFFCREEAPQRQHGIKGRGAVPLGQDETVTPGPSGLCGVHVHLVEIERGEDIRAGEGAAGMAGGGGVHRVHGQQPDLGGREPQVFARELFHDAIPFVFMSGEGPTLVFSTTHSNRKSEFWQ